MFLGTVLDQLPLCAQKQQTNQNFKLSSFTADFFHHSSCWTFKRYLGFYFIHSISSIPFVLTTCLLHMGPEDPLNRKKYSSFLLMPIFRKLQEDSKNVLKSGAESLKSYPKFSKMPIIKSVARKGQIPLNLAPVEAILDQKNLTGLAGRVREGQNIAQNGPRFWLLSPLETSKWVQDPGNGRQMIPQIAPN